nr:MAG TPA: hypothetical protein [Caudoviricetes sp.]
MLNHTSIQRFQLHTDKFLRCFFQGSNQNNKSSLNDCFFNVVLKPI